eukprot:CAMPEP_0181322892 /NCGR_PEP_ID=MMETSP1101-20121128/19477_1 /TAXON_ID=46948 /ORGANISM="Rhodomonas abbreviata, Strain Caron Lab Isolate" /LENGTH=353 /DNA_ID=CAMNT_0023430849 /DNA_START=41 /DNA_END=1102 /DNA_ORIENTATION=+
MQVQTNATEWASSISFFDDYSDTKICPISPFGALRERSASGLSLTWNELEQNLDGIETDVNQELTFKDDDYSWNSSIEGQEVLPSVFIEQKEQQEQDAILCSQISDSCPPAMVASENSLDIGIHVVQVGYCPPGTDEQLIPWNSSWFVHDDESTVGSKRKSPDSHTSTTTGDSESEYDSPPSQPGSNKSMRGAHVREQPQIQKNAREGQKHWKSKLEQMRREWNNRRMWEHEIEYELQVKMCARSHTKSQHECLLRELQMASVDGLITPLHFTQDERDSFSGWTGFRIHPVDAAVFRRRIIGMFASPPNEKTLNNSLRRAGLVPEHGWGEAWSGIGCFLYDPKRRAKYGGSIN